MNFLSPEHPDMEYFEAQNFDIAIVLGNEPFDGILMARALEIPYFIY